MELRRYIQILVRRWPLILLCALFGTIGGYLSTSKTVQYSSTSVVYIGSRVLSSDTGNVNLSVDRQAALAESALAGSSGPDPDATATARTPSQLVAATTVTPTTAQLLEISVTDGDPVTAQTLADGLADAFVAKVKQLEPGTEGALPQLPAYKFQSATFPSTPVATSALPNLALGALFGLVVSGSIAFLLEYLDLTVRTVDAAEHDIGLPVLGVVPMLPGGLSHGSKRLRPVAPEPGVEGRGA